MSPENDTRSQPACSDSATVGSAYAPNASRFRKAPDPWSSYTRSSPAPGSPDAARRAFSASASGRRSRADTLSAKPTTR